MKFHRARARQAGLLALVLAGPGCGLILGLDDFGDAALPAGGGGNGGNDTCDPDSGSLPSGDGGSSCKPGLVALKPVLLSPAKPGLLGPLEPPFESSRLSYTVETSFWATELALEAAPAPGATLLLNGVPVSTGSTPRLTLDVGANTAELTVKEGDASTTYVIEVHRRAPVRLAPPAGSGLRFGQAVAAAGDILVVGAPAGLDQEGGVHAYRRVGPGRWEAQVAEIKGLGDFGASLSFDGTTLAIGAQRAANGELDRAGALHLLRLDRAGWREDRGSPRIGDTVALMLGTHVAVSGDRAAATSDNYNVVHTYSRSSEGEWSEDTGSPLEASDGLAFIEGAITLDRDWLVVGSHNASGGPTALLYRLDASAGWLPPERGDTALRANGMFADSLALADRTLVVNGEPVRVFQRGTDDTWANTPLPVDSLGPVALGEETLVVGAQQDPYGKVTGTDVRVYRRGSDPLEWDGDPISPLPSAVGAAEEYGAAVAVSGWTVVVGAPGEAPAGAVYIYD